MINVKIGLDNGELGRNLRTTMQRNPLMQNNSQIAVELVKEVVEDIPVLVCSRRDARRKPLIILSHGFSENKESWIPYLQTLAEEGYCGV